MHNSEDTFDKTFQTTSKKIVTEKVDDNYDDAVNDLTTGELTTLLSFMEGELEAKEDVIDHLKKERIKLLLADVKYGKISMNDPFSAFRRDDTLTKDEINDDAITQSCKSQTSQLEKLIIVQRNSQQKTKIILSSLETKHRNLIRKLEEDRNARIKYAKQGDDLVAHLEKEKNNLNQQIEFHINNKNQTEIEKNSIALELANEKKKHESIVLYLINERKLLLTTLHELKLSSVKNSKNDDDKALGVLNEREIIDELRKEVTFLRGERESLSKTQQILKKENQSLRETVRSQAGDLMLLRKNMNTTRPIEKHTSMLPQIVPDTSSSLIMANRGATTSPSHQNSTSTTSQAFPPSQSFRPNRIPNSNTFPTEKTKFQKPTASRKISSPIRKPPAMGVSSTVRRPPCTFGAMSSSPIGPNSSTVSELDKLETEIQSMNLLSKLNPFQHTSTAKRSSSIPLEKNNNTSLRRSIIPSPKINSVTSSGNVSTKIASHVATSTNELRSASSASTLKRNEPAKANRSS